MDPVILPGQPAPSFCLPGLDGRQHCLDAYRGRIVVLNFWSAECPHSARVDGEMLKLFEVWGDGVVVLPIASNANETREQARLAAAPRGLPVVLLDAGHRVADLYGAQTTPHLYIIDRDGLLRYQGAFDDMTFRRRIPTRGYVQEAVQALLGGLEPAEAVTPAYGCSLVRFGQV
jgi:peroxiredoxin